METRLNKYHKKRDFSKTKEPQGGKSKGNKTRHFVIQHHLASHDHYDFRLEWNGVLKSWAIPKGPSYNPQEKRLAVMVEDHPLEYRHFEGIIPQGEYGGGTVMIIDEGTWQPENKLSRFPSDMLKFTLKGHRFKGKWVLIHTTHNNWLLIKEPDAFYEFADIKDLNRSIKTHRTMVSIAREEKSRGKTNYEKNILDNITITHPQKVIFKKNHITKWDIAKYYYQVASRMLPYIENRFVSVIRAPNGVSGSCFFRKHLDNKLLHHHLLHDESGQKKEYYYLTTREDLLSEVQMNSFEFHMWGSEVEKLEHPNLLVFDFDPDTDVNLHDLRQGVKDLKQILDDLKLSSFLKTSGGKGYHVLVFFNTSITWRKLRMHAKQIAEMMATKWPDRYTSNMRLKDRQGRIFIDWIRNTRGATTVAPYSLRLRDKCTVSMPIAWNELDKVRPDGIDINEALKRLKRRDPWQDFFN